MLRSQDFNPMLLNLFLNRGSGQMGRSPGNWLGSEPAAAGALKIVHPPGLFPELRAKIRMRNRDQFVGPLANGLSLE